MAFIDSIVKKSKLEEGTTNIDIEIEVSTAVEAEKEEQEAGEDMTDLADDIEDGATAADIVEEVQMIAQQYGCTPTLLRLIDKFGLNQIFEQDYEIVVPGIENINATGRNEAEAMLIIKGCEASLQEFVETVRKFFKEMLIKITRFVETAIANSGINLRRAGSAAANLSKADFRKMPPSLPADAVKMNYGQYVGKLHFVTTSIKALSESLAKGEMVTVQVNEATDAPWSVTSMKSAYDDLKAAFTAAQSVKGAPAAFKKIADEALASSNSEDPEAQAKVKQLRALTTEAARQLREIMSTLNSCASSYTSAANAFMKAAKEGAGAPQPA